MRFLPLLVLPVVTASTTVAVAMSGQFVDVPANAWFSTYVQAAADIGIVSGYKDAQGNPTGFYGPERSITVAELVKIASEGAGYDETKYSQLEYTAWYDNYVFTAQANGFSLEQWPGDWVWSRPAARVEVAAVLAKAFNVPVDQDGKNAFHDTGDGMFYVEGDAKFPYRLEINALARDGVISGDTDASGTSTGTFRPVDHINRAEVAKMIMKMRARYGVSDSPDGIPGK